MADCEFKGIQSPFVIYRKIFPIEGKTSSPFLPKTAFQAFKRFDYLFLVVYPSILEGRVLQCWWYPSY